MHIPEGDNFILEVKDNGIGIKPEYLEKILSKCFSGGLKILKVQVLACTL